MILLDWILICMQLAIIYRLIHSSIWSSHRRSTECIKVIYSAIGFNTVIVLVLILGVSYITIEEKAVTYIHGSVLTILIMYSLVCYHVVYIFDKRRITKKRDRNAITRPISS
jgi:hypothetical protein